MTPKVPTRSTLFVLMAVAGLATVYMASEYVETYRRILRTEVTPVLRAVTLEESSLTLELQFEIWNPISSRFRIHRIEYTLHLNNQYMTRDSIVGAFEVIPNESTVLDRTVIVPPERMFTVSEALQTRKWMWTVSGSAYTMTYFGETLMRFKSSFSAPPS